MREIKQITGLLLAVILVFAAAGCIRIDRPEDSAAESKTESTAESSAESMAESSAADVSTAAQSSRETEDKEMQAKLQQVQGEWYDINGDTMLFIDGDQVTFRFGKYEQVFTVAVEQQGVYWFLVEKNGQGLGFISDIEIRDDGSLSAYEMVLDADGHDFHFVREDQIAEERRIVDLSKDMPKQIESTEIRDFTLTFSTTAGRSYNLDDRWRGAHYSWSIEKQSDGTYWMTFSQGYDSYMGIQFSDEVSKDYVDGLAAKIAEMDLAAHNGYYQQNNVNLPGYYLYVKYESKEKLTIQAEGNAADTCVFDLAELMEYVFLLVDTEK